MVISFFTGSASPERIVLGTLAVMLTAVGHIAWSIDMDIKNPTINLQGDESSSVTSRSTPRSIIIGLVLGFLLGIVIILMSNMQNLLIPYLILIGFSFVFALYRVYILVLRIHMCYNKIEM